MVLSGRTTKKVAFCGFPKRIVHIHRYILHDVCEYVIMFVYFNVGASVCMCANM